ncbi:MAG TPA: flagellar motor switch protein FliM [Candidatus Pseudogracilibacillus intestinigallinarum]|uniref:Flagellar motor switch protein FliM n=1 Tax=Candidatus Pseudogracilibacillus intestinigallinarum TaxID=2838742 RepID=A0A9D1PQM4_9BACI|nr:flagellar motor switch protein FliM [Candidatus Pseudogracilibacillus intestinigallinarum]
MSEEILSQTEIDALLSAISSGEMDAEELKKEEEDKKVKVYDFKRALRFSKDQIRSISRIHENYARLLTTFFSGQLRTYVNISVASVDQIPYEEFIRSIPKMTILNVISMEPLEGKILMEVNPNIAYSMMDRLLGGKGNSDVQPESLTEIETTIMTQMFEKAVVNIQEAWSTIVEIDPMLDEFEVNPQFLQMVSPNETVVVVSFNTQIGDVSGMINICIPHIVLEPIIPKLSAHYWMESATKERDPEKYAILSKHMEKVELEAKVILGQSNITVNELLQLSTEDIISLNQKIQDPLTLEVNGEPKMHVQVGTVHKKVAVQVMDHIERRSLS